MLQKAMKKMDSNGVSYSWIIYFGNFARILKKIAGFLIWS